MQAFTTAIRRGRKEPQSDRFYTWYAANTLKHTQGGHAGKLVHGVYVLSNHNKDLLARGRFRYGLKVGQWQHWYTSGQTRAVEQWKKGRRHGRYLMYDMEGNVREKGGYRHGRLHGKRIRLEAGQPAQKEKYRKGKLLEKKRQKKRNKKEDAVSNEPAGKNTIGADTRKKQGSFRERLMFWKKKTPDKVSETGSGETGKKKQDRRKRTNGGFQAEGGKATKKKRTKDPVSQ